MTVYLQLLWSFFQIGLFSIGGGYAAMPLIQHQAVELHGWLTMTCGYYDHRRNDVLPIATNSATFVGMQIAGVSGAIVATLGCILPSCVIVTTLAWVYSRWKVNPISVMVGAGAAGIVLYSIV